MLICLASYSTRLLKVLHKGCNMDILRILLIYLHSPLGTVCPRDHVYISVKPLAAVLQPINTYTRVCVCVCVTGYWKTDWNVTPGLFHFISPADSHTHTLPVHCCINRLSWLVCFSRAGFADHVKLWLRQWGPWRALDGRYGSDIHLCVSETSLRSSGLVLAYD